MACALALAGCQSGYAPETRKQTLRQPDKGLVTATLASAAERSGDLVSAQAYYGQLIASGHASGQIYERRGEILLALGVPREAAAVFASALTAGFDSLIIRRGYGRALAWLSQPDAALIQYDAALARSPVDVKAMNGRGVTLDMLGRHDAAQVQYRLAMTQAPNDLAVRNNLAMSYALSGNVVEAVVILERIHASGSSTVQHRQNLALLYGLLGRTDKAQALASQDLSPEDAARNMATYATMQVLYDASQPMTAVAALPAAAAPKPQQVAETTPAPVAPPAGPSVQPAPPKPAEAPPAAPAAVQPPPPAPVATPQPPAAPAGNAAPAVQAKPVQAASAAAPVSGPAAAAPAEPKTQIAQVRQPWVVDLGVFETDVGARETWQRIKQEQPQFGQSVHYLEPEGTTRRLLAGPFWGEEAARTACVAVRGQGLKCDPRQASAVRPGAAGQSTAPEAYQR